MSFFYAKQSAIAAFRPFDETAGSRAFRLRPDHLIKKDGGFYATVQPKRGKTCQCQNRHFYADQIIACVYAHRQATSQPRYVA